MLHLSLHAPGSGSLLLLVLGAASGYGSLALSLLDLPQMTRREGLLFGPGLGLGVLSLLVLLLGAMGLIYPAAIWALLGLGLALAIPGWRWLRRLRPTERRGPPRAPGLSERAAHLGLLLIIGLALIYTLAAHALLPPVDNDVVAYHFAIPKLYIQAHRLIYLPYILHSNWPLGSEMLALIGLILQSEALALLTSWVFIVLLCAAMVAFGERWLPAGSGWIAAALLCSLPMLTMLAGTGMVEVPLAGYTFLAFYALWHWHESGSSGWLLLSALLAGCAAATKLNAAATAIVFAVAAMARPLLRAQIARALRAFALYGLASFLVVLPWYIKSWAFTGNPIWPFLFPILGGSNWDALGSTYLLNYLRLINMPPTLANWLTGPWQITVANGRFGSFLIGPYLLALLPLGLLPAVARPRLRPLLVLLAAVTVAFYTIWFLLTNQTRFLLSCLPCAILIGAAGVAWLWEIGARPLRVVLQVALLAWLLAGSWLFNADRQRHWQLSQPYLLGQIDREAFLTSIYPDFPTFSYANQHLPPTARVLMVPYEVRGYYLDRAYIWGNPIGQRYLRLEQIADVEALRAELQRLGVSHVLLNTHAIITDIAYWDHINALLSGLVEQHGRLLVETGTLRLYALDDRAPDPAGEAPRP